MRVKEVLHYADTLHRFGFLVFNARRLAGPPLQAAHDVLFHNLRGHTGIETDDLCGRCFEGWQQVGWNLHHTDATDHSDHQHDHDHQVRVLQCSSNHEYRIPRNAIDAGRIATEV